MLIWSVTSIGRREARRFSLPVRPHPLSRAEQTQPSSLDGATNDVICAPDGFSFAFKQSIVCN